MPNEHFSYTIETDIPSSYLRGLMSFIYRKYLVAQKQRFKDVSRRIVDGNFLLTFNVLDSTGKHVFDVEIKGDKPLQLTITPLDERATRAAAEEIKQDIIIATELFEEKSRKGSIFFSWREGEQVVPEKLTGKEGRSINMLFLETQILLFVLFISLGMVLFLFAGWLAPLILLAIQFIFVFYSYKFISRMADWQITENNPTIHLLEYYLPVKEQEAFKQKLTKEKLVTIKKEIYDKVLSQKGEINCETASKVFEKHGFACTQENLSSKKVNVYQLVKKTAEKFNFPMPKIVVSNTILPNAAASGPSPSRGIVLITTGLFVQLEENEIISVLGHEFGHLKGRDPLLLYGLSGAELLFRFYVLFPLLPFVFFSYLFLVYFWAVMTLIYFIAKFFESRADLISAITIGQPNTLANALEKIGFRKLLFERAPAYRFQEWLSFDPHPPIYFRVNRLEMLQTPVNVKHPLIQSAKDVINGFFASF